MERIVFLLGTSHACQGGYENIKTVSDNDLLEFKTFLRETCRTFGIKAICEEMRPENLDGKYNGISIPTDLVNV